MAELSGQRWRVMPRGDEQLEERGRELLRLARAAISAAVAGQSGGAARSGAGGGVESGSRHRGDGPAGSPSWLSERGACFVTLTRDGLLRGCIGSITARRPLLEDVRANARAAALADPRFPPVTAAELPRIRVEVSLLSPPEELPSATEEEAIASLRPGLDGVILEAGPHQSTFLPQVWEQLATPHDFLAQLKHKAGLPRGGWPAGTRLWRYQVIKWSEETPPS